MLETEIDEIKARKQSIYMHLQSARDQSILYLVLSVLCVCEHSGNTWGPPANAGEHQKKGTSTVFKDHHTHMCSAKLTRWGFSIGCALNCRYRIHSSRIRKPDLSRIYACIFATHSNPLSSPSASTAHFRNSQACTPSHHPYRCRFESNHTPR